MPTPRDSTDELPTQVEQSLHATCPPELLRPAEWRTQLLERGNRADVDPSTTAPESVSAPPFATSVSSQPLTEATQSSEQQLPHIISNIDQLEPKTSGRISLMEMEYSPPDLTTDSSRSYQDVEEHDDPALDLPISSRLGIHSRRLIQTHTSSMLRAGSKFRGTQQSDAQKYKVEVDIKSVDMSASSICGYLRIEGLTPEHATLTTCFEGEIIGPKYTFQTRHEDWGATDKDDMKAWARFPAWRAVGKQAKKSADFHYKNSTNRENMFMRWKEKFLVPDHRVREITGASFEGFYYICFNQVVGTITGIYYHAKTDNNNKVQQLELKWVNDHGCFAATEFR